MFNNLESILILML